MTKNCVYCFQEKHKFFNKEPFPPQFKMVMIKISGWEDKIII